MSSCALCAVEDQDLQVKRGAKLSDDIDFLRGSVNGN